MILRENYFWGLRDEPYLFEVDVHGKLIGGCVLSSPGSTHKSRRISAALVALNISERLGQQNPVAAARLMTELQGI